MSVILGSFSHICSNCARLCFVYKPKHVAHSTENIVKICCDCPFIHLVIHASLDGRISQLNREKFSEKYVFPCKLKVHTEVGCRFRDSGGDLSVKNLDHNREVC